MAMSVTECSDCGGEEGVGLAGYHDNPYVCIVELRRRLINAERELRQWRTAHDTSGAEGEVSPVDQQNGA
jgi:hypothetical protein